MRRSNFYSMTDKPKDEALSRFNSFKDVPIYEECNFQMESENKLTKQGSASSGSDSGVQCDEPTRRQPSEAARRNWAKLVAQTRRNPQTNQSKTPIRQESSVRRKSQWDELINKVHLKRSLQSGVFKVTLHQLARDGESQTLNELLKTVPEQQRRRVLNTSTDEEGVTALHLSSRHNHYDVCKLLIDYGANVDSRGEGNATPLHYAARYKPKKRALQDAVNIYMNQTQQTSSQSVIALLASMGAHVNFADHEGHTPLHAACIKGNTVAVNQLLQCQGIAIESTDSQGMTPLHIAATHGHVDIAMMLLQHGASLHCYDNDLMTPLHFAASEGNIKIVQMILQKGRDETNKGVLKKMLFGADAGKNTCLHLAVSKGHKHVAEELLRWSGVDAGRLINTPRTYNDIPLHVAASQGHTEIAKLLIDSGATVDARNDSLATPLLLAAKHNNYLTVELLLQRNANLEAREKDNLTSLLVVAKHGHLETVSWLIENGADVTATDKNDKSCLMLAVEEKRTQTVKGLLRYDEVRKLLGETDKNANSVLHIAAKKGYLPIIKILVDNGAKIDFKNEDEATPVHIAAMYGQHVALRELLDHDKTMINSLDENANTALHLAATEGHTKSIQVLLEHDANVGLRNTRQWTALDCACTRGWESAVLELLQAQSPINPPRGSRTTPLHQACLNSNVQVVKILLDWKADVSACVSDGRNPLDCAIISDSRECVQTILQHHTWKHAMRNAYVDPVTGQITTPARKLIINMPDMAELLFSRCIADNGKSADEMGLVVNLDYEFLDDMYTVLEWIKRDEEIYEEKDDIDDDYDVIKSPIGKSPTNIATTDDDVTYQAFTDQGQLAKNAMTYTSDTNVLRHNHPLMIMVNRKQEGLLQHPVVTGLLQYKWNKYGGLVYYSSLVFLLLFVALLNCYLLLIPPPYSVDYHKSMANRRFYTEFETEHITNYTAPKICYSLLQSGAEYRGFERKSDSGHDCIPWEDTSTNSQLFPDSGLDDNYCRNPGTQLNKPWCYTNYSDSDPTKRSKEICKVPPCPVFVKGSYVPLGAQCHFPFIYKGASFDKCIAHTKGAWCGITANLDIDNKWGRCTEIDTLCIIDGQLKQPCGKPGIDRLNCEARDCCYVVNEQGTPLEWSECYKKLNPCTDRSSYCKAYKSQGQCEEGNPKRETMEIRCTKTCQFCNESDNEATVNQEYQDFLYLMSVYPRDEFDHEWLDGCYYIKEGAHDKWGGGCHFKKTWQDPIRIVLLVLCILKLALLVLQVWNYHWEAFQPIFFLETTLAILCLLLAFDFNSFDEPPSRQMESEIELYEPLIKDYQSETGLRQNWQWQCGAMSLFLSWMDLLLYIRKIPYLGIYVVMFNDVFKTFVKFSLVFLLFILSFAFTYHILLQNERQFEEPFHAILKTTVMMVGEIDFGGIFFSTSKNGFSSIVNYELVTHVIFSIFIIVMMIIVMNLLVGLAVGDIIEVKEHATLERLKMQVELALEVEFSVPNFLRKRFVRKYETVQPNRYRKSNAMMKAFFQNRDLSSKNIVNAMNPNKSDIEEIKETVTQLSHAVGHVRHKTSDVEGMIRDMVGEVREIRGAIMMNEARDILSRDEMQRSYDKDRSEVPGESDSSNDKNPPFSATNQEKQYDYTDIDEGLVKI